MKIFVTLFLLIPALGYGVVVDTFNCYVAHFESGVSVPDITTSVPAVLPRLPHKVANAPKGVTFTRAIHEFTTEYETKNKSFSLYLNVYHAVKSVDNKMMAAQYTCLGLYAYSNSDVYNLDCEDPAADPFSKGSHWEQVPISGGVPGFAHTNLVQIVKDKDGGNYFVNCLYLGTQP